MEKLNQKIFKGAFWSLVFQLSYIIVLFISNIILTRFLSPEEFGEIGIVMFFVILSGILVEGGFGGALVRKEKATNDDFTTVFTISFIVSIIIGILLIVVSPYIGDYYENSSLTSYLRFSSLILFFNSFQIVPSSKLIIEMRFKERGIARLVSIVLSSIIGIYLAYINYGVWSFLYLQLLYALLFPVLMSFFVRYRINLKINKTSLKNVFEFGIYTTTTSFLNTVFDNIYQVLIAKFFGVNRSGLYYQAKRLQDVPVNLINMLLQGVFFSGLSKTQNDRNKFNTLIYKATILVAVIMGIFVLTIYTLSYDILTILYGEKWSNGAFYLEMLILVSFFYVQEVVIRVIFKVLNKTKYILKIDFYKKILQVVTIILAIYFENITYLLLGYLISSIFGCVIYFYQSSKYLEYSKKKNRNLFTLIIIVTCFLIFTFLIKENYVLNLWESLGYVVLIILAYLLMLDTFKVFKISNYVIKK